MVILTIAMIIIPMAAIYDVGLLNYYYCSCVYLTMMHSINLIAIDYYSDYSLAITLHLSLVIDSKDS